MSETYKQMRARCQAEYDAFPIKFAYSKEEFEKGMMELGLKPSDTDKVYLLGDTNGFFRKTDASALYAMLDAHLIELKRAIEADLDGSGFIYQMFSCELAEHGYGQTHNVTETLNALGFTTDWINLNPPLLVGLQKAIADYK